MGCHLLDGGVASAWNFAIDRGGTFTDIVAWNGEGRFRTEKLLSENPGQYADAAIEGIARILKPKRAPSARSGWARPSPPTRCSSARAIGVALAITRGFGDALRIGYQARPEIFARHIVLPEHALRGGRRDRRAGRRGRRDRDSARRGSGPAPT